MVYNLKQMFRKQSITFLLILSIVSSGFYLPNFAPKAEAFWGVLDATLTINEIVRALVDGIAVPIAQQMVNSMVQSTVKWAQTGFEGNPAYATNPKQYFTDIADNVAGKFIGGTDLGFLCSPFQAKIRLTLQKQYTQGPQFQCSLTGVVGNINAFYGDFSQGGWDGWFSMTQNSSNNPYGAFIDAQVELDKRLAEAVGLESKTLDWNQGFRNFAKCIEYEQLVVPDPLNPGRTIFANGKCLERDPTTAPGATIKAQLDKVLPSGLEQLIKVEHIEQLISSFANGLLQRYVFGPKGLFASNAGGSSSPVNINNRLGKIDLDGDKIPEGQDFDQDGKLDSPTDICYHGGNPPNCINSGSVTTSPYFTPICQAIDQAVLTLKDYTDFLDTYAYQMNGGAALAGTIIPPILAAPTLAIAYTISPSSNTNIQDFVNKADAGIWGNRTTEVSNTEDEILNSIQTYSSSYFDNIEVAVNRYAVYIGNVLQSLIKDPDLNLDGASEKFEGLENLMRLSAFNLVYLKEAKAQIGKCDSPSIGTIGAIPIPPHIPPGTVTPPPINTIPPTIVASIDLGGGTFPDPVYHNGKIYIAVQQGPALSSQLNLYSFDPDLSNQQVVQIPFSGVGLAFQRIVVNNGILWVIFRDGENSVGAIPESIRLWRADTGAVENLGNVVGSGNDPVAIGNGYIAWQNQVGGTITIFRRSITGGTITNLGAGAPTGLSRIMPGGSVVLIDTDRNMFPWGTRFWLAGSLAVAEDFTPPPDNGIVGRFNNDPVTEFNLWPAQVAHTPHAATDGFGNYVIATWNPTVRVAVVR